eukprot:8557037-Lingulodinium_polyedra.AAC.1
MAARLVSRISRPVRLWHGLQAKHNRSPKQMLKFYIDGANGTWLESLAQTFDQLQDLELLQFCFMKVDAPAINLHTDSIMVVAEDEKADVLVSYTFNLVKWRCRGLLPFLKSFPELFAALLSPKEKDQKRVLSIMEKAWGARQAAKKRTEPVVKKM